MLDPVLVTGAAGGTQGSTGRLVADLLLDRGIPVRAFVHRLDARSEELRSRGAEVIDGDLRRPGSMQAAMKGVRRAYFTYPVTDGLLEAATLFASIARDEGLELVVNNSQYQGLRDEPGFRSLHRAASFRNFQHLLVDRIFDWAQVGAVHLQTPPYFENLRALMSDSAANRDAVFLPWGDGSAVVPLTGAEDVAAVAATLLARTDLPSRSVYPLVTEALTVHEIVDTLSRAIGRPIRYEPITDEQWSDAMKDRINPHALDHLSHLWQSFRGNRERRQPTDHVREITGRNPQTLEFFFRTNAHFFASVVR